MIALKVGNEEPGIIVKYILWITDYTKKNSTLSTSL